MRVSFALVNGRRMKKLNKKYLGRDESTDVLAFPMKEKLPDGVYFLGEIVVNADAARRQAREYKVSEKEELARLITHGALHLLGYSDRSKKQREKMKKVEDKIVKCVISN